MPSHRFSIAFFAVCFCLLLSPLRAQLSYEGSSSIGNALLPELAKAFTASAGVAFGEIRPTSSNQGFAAVRDGKAVLGGLSRLLTTEELESGLSNRVIGYDALVIYVHAENPVASLSLAQLRDIFAGTATNWQAVDGPDLPIVTLVRQGDEGGVMGQFREVVMGETPLATPAFAFPTHQENIEYVASNPAAITFAALAGDRRLARVIAVEGILPSQDTLSMGQYQLGRPFTLVYRDDPNNADLQKFLDFVYSREGQAIVRKFVLPVLTFD